MKRKVFECVLPVPARYYRILSYLLGTSSAVIWSCGESSLGVHGLFCEYVIVRRPCSFAEAELAVLVCLFLAVLYDLTLFLGVALFRPSVRLTESQKKMLGIKNNGIGNSLTQCCPADPCHLCLFATPDFQTVSTPVPFGVPLAETPAGQSLSPITTPFSITPLLHFRTPTVESVE